MSPLDRRTFLGSTAGLASLAGLAGSAAATEDTSQIGRTPHTRFAVNVEMWFRKLPFLDRVRAAAALGFPAIEFWSWREKEKDKNKILDVLPDLAGELGIEIAQFTAWGFEPGMNDPKNHDAVVREIEESCRLAQRLRCRKMCVVGGNDQPGMTQDQMHANIIRALNRAAPIAEKYDVMLILEPMNIRVDHKGHCLYGSPPTVRICDEVGSSHVKINWDLYHMQITEGDLCGRLKDGFHQVGYLQLADHPGRHEPGTGEVHYNRVLRQAHELGYRDFVGLECSPLGDELAAAKAVAAADIW